MSSMGTQPSGQDDYTSYVANRQPDGLENSDQRLSTNFNENTSEHTAQAPRDTQQMTDSQTGDQARLNQQPDDGTMSDSDKEQLQKLQARQVEADRKASEPTEENFTHYVHLSDGRVIKARGAGATQISEGKGTQDDPERFFQVLGTYPR